MFSEIIMGRKHISTVGHSIDASAEERVGSTGDVEIDKEAEKSVSWSEVVKGGKCVKHAHKK